MLLPQQISTDPQDLGVQHELGNLTATYKPSLACSVIASVFVVIVGALLTAFVLFITISASNALLLLFSLVGLAIVAGGLYGIISTYRNRVLRVFVYQDGLVHVGRDAVRALHW